MNSLDFNKLNENLLLVEYHELELEYVISNVGYSQWSTYLFVILSNFKSN